MTTLETHGDQLYLKGWRQGSVIEATAPTYVVAAFGADAEPLEEVGVVGLVLATQDCDLVKDAAKIPYLEAIPVVVDAGRVRSTKANDARYFVLDPSKSLIADRARKVHLTRGALDGLETPGPPCGGDESRRLRLGQWLGSAYDRPALPNEFHPQLSVPLTRSVERAVSVGRPHAWLNDVLHEVRAAVDLPSGPPWSVELLLVLEEGADLEACEEAIGEILGSSGLSETGDRAVRVAGWRARPLSQISVLDYAESFPISLEMVSYSGDVATGLPPLRADPA